MDQTKEGLNFQLNLIEKRLKILNYKIKNIMSTRITNYLIYGFKLDSEFTEEFWDSENYDKYDSYSRKENEVRFLTDGMNGEYTYFGFIKELDPEEPIEVNVNYNKQEIIDKFTELYPIITIPEIKLISLPHWT